MVLDGWQKKWNTCNNFCLYRIHLLREIPASQPVSEQGKRSEALAKDPGQQQQRHDYPARRLITIIAITKLALGVLCPIESVRGLSCYYTVWIQFAAISTTPFNSIFCTDCRNPWSVCSVSITGLYSYSGQVPVCRYTIKGTVPVLYFCRTNIQTFIPILLRP